MITVQMSGENSIPLSVPRVKKAYEQVAENLRDLMHRGVISSGDRLPSETALAKQFGISRSTVREALRRLSAEDLIVTRKGAQGGSFVTLPTVDNISGFVSSNINLLTASDDVSLEEFLEARELLEVPAARLAAARSNGANICEVEDSIPADTAGMDTEQLFVYNRGFHSAVLAASCNTLLVIAAQPISSVMQTNLAHSTLSPEFHAAINQQHRDIARAIADGEGDEAADLMRDHLHYLKPFYETAWLHATTRRKS